VLVELKHPGHTALARVKAALAHDGLELDSSGGYNSVSATDTQLAAVFNAEVTYRMVPASAGSGSICAAHIERVRLPPRYAKDVAALRIGHQVCE